MFTQPLMLYNIPSQQLYPKKTLPDKYSLWVPVPPHVLREHKQAIFGSILIDKKDITYFATSPELNNVLLTESTYSLRIKENGEYISIRVPALDIFLNYEAHALAQKEDKDNIPVLHDVPRTQLLRWQDKEDYYLTISFPRRMLPHFETNIPIVYVPLRNDDVKPLNNSSFDITLKHTIYSVLVITNDSKTMYNISRSELIESYNNSQRIRAKNITERTQQTMEQADTASDPIILRHLFKKNVKPSMNGTVSIAIPVPASLKNKCSKWFCNLNVPSSCISPEPTINGTELVSLTLTQKTYEIGYPISDTKQYHKFHPTHWVETVVTREEIYEAHMQTLQTFDFYVKNGLT